MRCIFIMLSRTSLATGTRLSCNYNMPSSGGKGGWDGEDQGTTEREYEELRCMRRIYLVIKIWSNIKTSSCIHFMATCQDDLTQKDKTSGLGEKKIHDVEFPNHNCRLCRRKTTDKQLCTFPISESMWKISFYSEIGKGEPSRKVEVSIQTLSFRYKLKVWV